MHSTSHISTHNLDLYYNDDDPNVAGDEAENMNFVRFVDRILLLIDAGPLNKFSLVWDAWPISSHVISWINTAITRNVRELYLSLGECETFDIPISGFNCDSLQSLEVNANDLTFLYDATVVCLPRLESLTLHGVHFTSKEACEELISGCPMLHDLSLSIRFRYPGDDDFTCIISSASLRCLDIYFGDRSRLKLKASSLEYLCLRGRISGIFVEKSLSSLVQADFHIMLAGEDFLNNSIVEAVRAFHRAKFLNLSGDVMRALSRATISLSTEFTRLVRLKASTYCSSLQDFIKSSCNLDVLDIYQYSWQGTNDPHDLSSWNALVEVPRCLSNSLKEVHFYGYNGTENEREMILYMLKYGSVLEVMHISCYDKGGGEKLKFLHKEIGVFPRKFRVCKVQLFKGTVLLGENVDEGACSASSASLLHIPVVTSTNPTNSESSYTEPCEYGSSLMAMAEPLAEAEEIEPEGA